MAARLQKGKPGKCDLSSSVGSRTFAIQNGKLLPQGEIFEGQPGLILERGSYQRNQQKSASIIGQKLAHGCRQCQYFQCGRSFDKGRLSTDIPISQATRILRALQRNP